MEIKPTEGFVDLHIHSSEDFKENIKFIQDAKDRGAIAIGMVGKIEIPPRIDELIEFGKSIEVEVIPGVENSEELVRGVFSDFIGLGFDPNHPIARKYFSNEARRERNRELAQHQVGVLEKYGFSFDKLERESKELFDHVMDGYEAKKAVNLCRIVARTESNREALERFANENKRWKEVYNFYSGQERFRNQPRYLLKAKVLEYILFDFGREGYTPSVTDPEEIINAIHKAGGVVFYSPEGKFDQDVWDRFRVLEGDGIMLFHGGSIKWPSGARPVEFLRDIRKNGLIVGGGSDFDPNKNHWEIVTGDGSLKLSHRRLDELKERIEFVRARFSSQDLI